MARAAKRLPPGLNDPRLCGDLRDKGYLLPMVLSISHPLSRSSARMTW